jgi:DNA polymerase III delta prime subunit
MVALPTGSPDESHQQRRLRRATLKRHDMRFACSDERVSIKEAQTEIWQAMTDYLATNNPAHILLVKAPPGVGKTTLAVQLAEQRAEHSTGRVLYAGPRHEFFGDVMAIAQHPDWWYEWLPRQEGSDTRTETCRYACQINTWIARGYAAQDFCENHLICGPAYAYNVCPWHQQKQRPEPILFVQHQHVVAHPLLQQADLLIGDELPLSAFLSQSGPLPGMLIERDDVVIDALDEGQFRDMLRVLRGLIDTLRAEKRTQPIGGPELLHALGGAQYVQVVCEGATIPLACLQPYITRPEQADEVPLNYLGILLRLLKREVAAYLAGIDYPPRVIISQRGLTLLWRQWLSQDAPRHIIWLDATGNEQVYEEMFQRPIQAIAPNVRLQGKVYQIWNSLNTKATLTNKSGSAPLKGTSKTNNLARQVRRIVDTYQYTCPALISYRGLLSLFSFIPDTRKAYFYAARGTNRLQGCDALIVVGTPAPGGDIEHTAAMLFQERMIRFRATWQEIDAGFVGTYYSIPVANYHADADLAALMYQHREAEILQAAHRARPIRHPVDIWLLTNLPIDQLPPDELLTVNDLFDVPWHLNESGMREYASVDPYHWGQVLHIAEERSAAVGLVTSKDIAAAIGCSAKSARTYIRALVEHCNYMEVKLTAEGRGRPPLGCIPGLL